MRLVAVFALILGWLPGVAMAAVAACPISPPGPRLDLPHVRDVVNKGGPLVAVAIGSSSTEGSQASSPMHAYPAVLGEALASALPGVRVEVLNKGVGGQDAVEMMARFERDVLATRPSLVIWQVGANGALRGTDPAEFARVVGDGVARLQAAGMDVVLMDNQRAPQIQGKPMRAEIERALAVQARLRGVGLFSRGALMDAWEQAGHPNGEFLAADGLHHNDHGYACVAEALAAAVLADVAPRHRQARP